MDSMDTTNNVEAVTPNYHAGADEVVAAAKAEFTPEPVAPAAEDEIAAEEQAHADIIAAAHEAIDRVAEAHEKEQPQAADEPQDAAAEEEPPQPEEASQEEPQEQEPENHEDEEEQGEEPRELSPQQFPEVNEAEAETHDETEAPVPAPEPADGVVVQAPYQVPTSTAAEEVVVGAANPEGMTEEEEAVWRSLCAESTSRVDPNHRVPRNVWSSQERDALTKVSNAALAEMRGRLVTLLCGVEFTMHERSLPLHSRAGSSSQPRRSVTSRPTRVSRRGSSQASHAAAATENGSRPRTATRRRVLNEKGEIVRDGGYTPRGSTVAGTPLKGVNGYAPHPSSESGTLAVVVAPGSGRSTPRANSLTPAVSPQPVPRNGNATPRAVAFSPNASYQPSEEAAARPSTVVAARGGPGGTAVRRGSTMGSVPPSLTNRRRTGSINASTADRPPFDLNFNSSLNSSQRSAKQQHPRARSAARTPRSVRTDLQDAPEPLRTVPGAVHTKRLETNNPVTRRASVIARAH